MSTAQLITPVLALGLYGADVFPPVGDTAPIPTTRPVWRPFDMDGAVRELPGPNPEETRLAKANAVVELFRHFVLAHREYRDDLVDEALGDANIMNAYGALMEATMLAQRAARDTEPRALKPKLVRYPKVLLEDPRARRRVEFLEELQEQVTEARSRSTWPKLDAVTARDEQIRDPLWFMYDPGVPPELADAILGVRQMDVAYTLMMVGTEEQVWSPDILLRLVERMIASYRRFALFIAGLPGADIPQLHGDKLNVHEVIAKHEVRRGARSRQGQRAVEALVESKSKS